MGLCESNVHVKVRGRPNLGSANQLYIIQNHEFVNSVLCLHKELIMGTLKICIMVLFDHHKSKCKCGSMKPKVPLYK